MTDRVPYGYVLNEEDGQLMKIQATHANRKKIRAMAKQGFRSEDILREVQRAGFALTGTGAKWTIELIEEIVQSPLE